MPKMPPMPPNGEMPDPSDPRFQSMMKQHRDFVKDRKTQARFVPKQRVRRKKK